VPCLLGVALGCPPTDAPSLIVLAMSRAAPRARYTSRANAG
jgi:hypothetical protein